MFAYDYRARDNTGKAVRGVIEALSREEAAAKLRRMGYTPVTITEVFAGLKLPIIGPIVRKICISRFARTLSTLLGSGVPILESLTIVSNVVNNLVLGRVIRQTRLSVEKGEKLGESLKVSEEFPPDTVQMIVIGEESGNLVGMLNKISDFYDRIISYNIKKLVASLEPLLLVVMGVVVALTMASILLPMFNMVKTLRK